MQNKSDNDSIWSKVVKPILILIFLGGFIGVALWYEFTRPVPSSSQQKPYKPAAMPTRSPHSAHSTTSGRDLGINADLSN